MEVCEYIVRQRGIVMVCEYIVRQRGGPFGYVI